MNTCSTCKWWDRSEAAKWVQDSGEGACNSPLWLRGYSYKAPPLNGVLVEDDEGWGFFTGPEFGCIHWTEKS